MGDQTIYNALRSGGLSRTGACAMMGNMFCESGLKANNVEDRCTLGDFDYTLAVDSGTYSEQNFIHDSYGYGLCQWTSYDRKEGLLRQAKGEGVSIGDEAMQCQFCLYELQTQYPGLFSYLCKTENLAESAKRICAEFERPAVNNFADRINAAQRYFNRLAANDSGCCGDACPIEFPKEELCNVKVRILHKGCLGRDVYLLQCGLLDMGIDCGLPDGDFGTNTEAAVIELQRVAQMNPTGKADQDVWQIILDAR